MATNDRAWAEPRGWPARNLGRTLRMPPAATLALDGSGGAAMRKQLTAPAIRARKARDGGAPLVMVTAYAAPGARMADEAGVDLILVGVSVALVVRGYADTLPVYVADLAHPTDAVDLGLPPSAPSPAQPTPPIRHAPP